MAVSAQVLQQPHSAFRRLWLDGRLRRVPSRAREMFDLVPASGGIPDFLIPEDASSLDEALDVIVSASSARLRAELAQRHWRRQPPSWIQDLARGRSAAVRHLGQLVRSYHEEILEPFWPGVRRAMVTELNRRAWQLATHGAEAALNSLHAGIRWRGGVLEVDGPFDGVVDLDGRGLRVTITVDPPRRGPGVEPDDVSTRFRPGHESANRPVGAPRRHGARSRGAGRPYGAHRLIADGEGPPGIPAGPSAAVAVAEWGVLRRSGSPR
ncbi:hypothetical protein [Micromonospora carbonacea]|uniref:hypothetical protein n=1 Tax=Micromonospora carbonacea TaxID=47853 RepID=UPI00372433BF